MKQTKKPQRTVSTKTKNQKVEVPQTPQESQIIHFKEQQKNIYLLLKCKLKNFQNQNIQSEIFNKILPKQYIVEEGNPKKIKNSLDNFLYAKRQDLHCINNLQINFAHKLEAKEYNRLPIIDVVNLMQPQFQALSNLQTLVLDISQNELKAEGGIILGQSLKYLINLKKLDLILDDNELGKEGIIGIAEGLKNLTKMEEMNLKLCWNELGVKSVIAIGEAITNMKQIKDLNINFWQNIIKDKGMEGLSQQLSSWTSLESLQLNLMNNQITIDGVEFFAQGLEPLKNLKKINLNLTSNTELSSNEKQLLVDSCQQIRPKFRKIYV